MNWRWLAACQDSDPELWFPLRPGVIPDEAARLCASCPVHTQCLADAEKRPEQYGIRAGIDFEFRRLVAGHRRHETRQLQQQEAS